MENRIRKLEKLCRICGSKIMLKLGDITAKRCSDYSDDDAVAIWDMQLWKSRGKIYCMYLRYRSKYLQIWLATQWTNPIKLKSYNTYTC